jgi:hypothetical protein
MASIFQLSLSVLLGLALAAYGVFQAVRGYPGSDTWSRLADAMPTLGAVSFFVLAVAFAVGGLMLALFSGRRLRRRWKQRRVTVGVRSDPARSPIYRGHDDREYIEGDFFDDAYRPDHPHHQRNGDAQRAPAAFR